MDYNSRRGKGLIDLVFIRSENSPPWVLPRLACEQAARRLVANFWQWCETENFPIRIIPTFLLAVQRAEKPCSHYLGHRRWRQCTDSISHKCSVHSMLSSPVYVLSMVSKRTTR
ncbi:hypothetical protein BDW02DRAFT_91943 [Decorospora gaudefroyi]|uniref:Uncharacterized protein n=1 Tax=Decorospora gaudefroyi TaxID=184978 RepID=A0A6A5K2R0_9PLEO|nr:hypothetical protein BDW02DRAFT_91943 [Decorospora gaudefroyi]